MLLPLRRFGALFLLLATAFAGPSVAQDTDTLPQEADMLLWCSSALHLLGVATENETEAGNYFAASQMLVEKAAETLMAAEIPSEDVEGIVALYDERVVTDFESGGELPYTSDACIAALDLQGL
ncbi:hypothetical protein [Pelagibacterium halotolerans]|uniref:hypothetical protein n=1 Tax=Pelagibacterium halotolerans TaxID=531813 RepID=UPI00384D15F5